jgi:hypothetical protein
MLRKIHGTNFFHIKFLDLPNIKSQNGPVLLPLRFFILMVRLYALSHTERTIVILNSMDIYIYHSRFIPVGVAEGS